MKELIEYILKNIFVTVILPIAVSFGTFIITSAQYQQDVKKKELDNVQTTITIYKNIAADLQEQINIQKAENAALRIELEFLKDEIKKIKKIK